MSPADEDLYERFQSPHPPLPFLLLYSPSFSVDCHQIRLDVQRTFRDHPLFAKEDSPYLVRLRDILYTYAYFNPSLEYSQGMNDLAAILLLVLGEEVDSFWCFKGSLFLSFLLIFLPLSSLSQALSTSVSATSTVRKSSSS